MFVGETASANISCDSHDGDLQLMSILDSKTVILHVSLCCSISGMTCLHRYFGLMELLRRQSQNSDFQPSYTLLECLKN